MKKTVIIVHGGAGPDSPFIRQNKEQIKQGLEEALKAGYSILEKEGKALDAVEAAVKSLENNPYFNAGRGAALNDRGEVEMCASIMEGKELNSGAVAIVKNIKHPVSLAKAIMQNTSYIYLGGEEAVAYAKEISIGMEPHAYFITEHQYDEYAKSRADAFESGREAALKKMIRSHGTVGAVALDADGNLAAATSTGGTTFGKAGRIGDSSMIGTGTYASNKACAVSATGDGEYLIRGVIAHRIASYMAYKKKNVKEACKEVIHVENGDVQGDLGVIALDAEGNIAVEFKAERMHRGWMVGSDAPVAKIYPD
jgi:beta-aspartyl-peptidase (threonine type)